MRIVPKIGNPQKVGSRISAMLCRETKSFGASSFEDLVAVYPQNPFRVCGDHFLQQKVLVSSFIQSLERRMKDLHSLTKRLADRDGVVGRVIIEDECAAAQSQRLRENSRDVTTFVLDAHSAKESLIAMRWFQIWR